MAERSALWFLVRLVVVCWWLVLPSAGFAMQVSADTRCDRRVLVGTPAHRYGDRAGIVQTRSAALLGLHTPLARSDRSRHAPRVVGLAGADPARAAARRRVLGPSALHASVGPAVQAALGRSRRGADGRVVETRSPDGQITRVPCTTILLNK